MRHRGVEVAVDACGVFSISWDDVVMLLGALIVKMMP